MSAAALAVAVVAVAGPAVPAQAWALKPSDAVCASQPAKFTLYVGDAPQSYQAPLRQAAVSWTAAGTPVAIDLVSQRGSVAGASDIGTDSNAARTMGAYASMETTTCRSLTGGSFVLHINEARMEPLSQRDRTLVFVHELGHALGLGHTYVNSCLSILYASFTPGQCLEQGTGPYADDIAGVLARFAPNQTPAFPANSALSIGAEALRSTNGLNWFSESEPTFVAPTDSGLFRWTFVPKPGSSSQGRVVNTGSGACLVDPALEDSVLTVDYCGEKGVYWTVNRDPSRGTQLKNSYTRKCVGLKTYWFGSDRGGAVECTDPTSWLNIGTPPVTPIHEEQKRSLSDLGSQLIGQGSSKCLDAPNADTNPGAGAQLATCATVASQQWLYNLASRSLSAYNLNPYSVPENSGTFIDPARCLQTTGTANGTAVVAAACQGTPNQAWEIHGNGNLFNPASGRCLNAQGGGTSAGTAAILYTCSGDSNTIWNLQVGLNDGAPVTIRTLEGTGKVLTASQQLGILSNDVGAISQQWSFIPSPHESFGQLADHESGRCLTVQAGSSVQAALHPCSEGGAGQQWTPVPNPNGSVTFQIFGNQCLDLFSARIDDGSAIGNYSCNGQYNQQWRIRPDTTAPTGDPRLAVAGTASQSSTFDMAPYGAAQASRAIDGNTSGDFLDNSVTHTNGEAHPWWSLDLGKSAQFTTITIYNRTDCCSERLSNFWIFKSAHAFADGLTPQQQAAQPGVAWYHNSGTAGSVLSWTDDHGDGSEYRYIRIQLESTNVLSLAEVSVE